MKTLNTHLKFLILIFLLVNSFIIHGQDRDSIKLVSLKDKVERLELKLAMYEAKVFSSDSLIELGKKEMEESRLKYDSLILTQEQFEENYKNERKNLSKLKKSKDEEEAEKALDDLEDLDKDYLKQVKNYEKEIELIRKSALKAESKISKGEDKKFTVQPSIEETEFKLEEAKINYESYLQSVSN